MKNHPLKIEVFADEAGQYRWHTIATNGKKTATSGEAFDSFNNAVRAATKHIENIRTKTVNVTVEGQIIAIFPVNGPTERFRKKYSPRQPTKKTKEFVEWQVKYRPNSIKNRYCNTPDENL